MFGNELSIGHHFADFRIDYFEIPGTSYANATNRYTFRISEMKNIWEYYLAIIQRLRLYADNVFVGINQMGVGIEESPKLDALREALVNMLMHADYFSPMKSRIRVFTDRIEFENPGGFPRPIDELLRTDVSIPRNPVIAKLFRCAKLCENAGFGFDKMQQWNEEDSKLVSFRDEKMDCALVVFRRLEVKRTIIENPPENPSENPPENPPEKLDDLDVLIVSLLKDNPKITYDKLSDMTGKHRDTIRVHLNTLREKGFIVRVGPDKGGHWNVVEPLRATTNNIQTP